MILMSAQTVFSSVFASTHHTHFELGEFFANVMKRRMENKNENERRKGDGSCTAILHHRISYVYVYVCDKIFSVFHIHAILLAFSFTHNARDMLSVLINNR